MMNLKNSVEPQRHREKTKLYAAKQDHPSGERRQNGNPLIYGISLCLCVSVVRNLG